MKILLIPSAILALVVYTGRSQVFQQDARAIVQRAISCHGGAELLAKYKATRFKCKGNVTTSVGSIPCKLLQSFEAPDKLRCIQLCANHCKTIIAIGDAVRLILDGKEIKPVPPADITMASVSLFVRNVGRLVTLIDNPAYTLILAEECKVCGRAAQGVKVIYHGRKDVTLYFDVGTGMLVKCEYTGCDATGQPAPFEEIYMNYKDVRGIMFPTRVQVMMRGQKYCEYDVLEILAFEQFDAKEFVIP